MSDDEVQPPYLRVVETPGDAGEDVESDEDLNALQLFERFLKQSRKTRLYDNLQTYEERFGDHILKCFIKRDAIEDQWLWYVEVYREGKVIWKCGEYVRNKAEADQKSRMFFEVFSWGYKGALNDTESVEDPAAQV